MMVIKFTDYLKESADISSHDGILVIVDVQKEFSQFQPRNLVNNIFKYCKEFPVDDSVVPAKGVYQIWDANKAQNFSYNFPNTVLTVKKNYGTKFDGNIEKISNDLMNKYPNAKEGQSFKLNNENAYIVRVKNNHKWFYVNEDLYNLYLKLKGKIVVLVGGASRECILDVYESMESFGIKPVYNNDYIYSAKTNDDQVVPPK